MVSDGTSLVIKGVIVVVIEGAAVRSGLGEGVGGVGEVKGSGEVRGSSVSVVATIGSIWVSVGGIPTH